MPTSLYDTFPPSCLNRADGNSILGMPGTVNSYYSIFQQFATPYQGFGTFFEEDPNSPEFNFGDQATIVHTFYMDINTFNQITWLIQRGQWQLDSYGNLTRILNSSAQFMKGQYYKVTVTAECVTFNTPPDEFSIRPVEINPDLMKHPRYNGTNNANAKLTDQQKAAIRFALSQQTSYGVQNAFSMIVGGSGVTPGGSLFPNAGSSTPDPQLQMAWEVLTKEWRGTDSFYLPAFEVTWSSYYYNAVEMDPGGYIDTVENMTAQIPYEFWSLDGTDDTGDSNFDNVSFANPYQFLGEISLYSGGITYLKKADQDDYVRTWHRVTSTWIGSPTGNSDYAVFWDPDLYQTYGQPPTNLGNEARNGNPPYPSGYPTSSTING